MPKPSAGKQPRPESQLVTFVAEAHHVELLRATPHYRAIPQRRKPSESTPASALPVQEVLVCLSRHSSKSRRLFCSTWGSEDNDFENYMHKIASVYILLSLIKFRGISGHRWNRVVIDMRLWSNHSYIPQALKGNQAIWFRRTFGA
jgi:hypothetical protein